MSARIAANPLVTFWSSGSIATASEEVPWRRALQCDGGLALPINGDRSPDYSGIYYFCVTNSQSGKTISLEHPEQLSALCLRQHFHQASEWVAHDVAITGSQDSLHLEHYSSVNVPGISLNSIRQEFKREMETTLSQHRANERD